MTEFNKYLKEAREEFCKEVSKYNVSDNLQLRTACDSFLIAFDQATEKAINYSQCCMSEAEQLFCDCEIPKPTDPYDVVDKHICRDCKQIIAK